MYAKYVWNAGATAANILADLVAIYTSAAPNIAALSAACDKAQTTIIANTVNTNWTVYDAAAGTNTVCLRSLNIDGTTYKYITLAVTATPSLVIKAYESWNATTHVGLNVSSCLATPVPIVFTNSGNVLVSVTDRYIGLMTSVSYLFVFEFSRGSSVINSLYPCIIAIDSGSSFISQGYAPINAYIGVCRVKDPANSLPDLVGSQGIYAGGLTGAIHPPNKVSTNGQQSGGGYGTDGARHLMIMPIQLIISSLSVFGYFAYLGQVLGNVMLCPIPSITITNGDELVSGTETYIMVSQNSSAFLLPKA